MQRSPGLHLLPALRIVVVHAEQDREPYRITIPDTAQHDNTIPVEHVPASSIISLPDIDLLSGPFHSFLFLSFTS